MGADGVLVIQHAVSGGGELVERHPACLLAAARVYARVGSAAGCATGERGDQYRLLVLAGSPVGRAGGEYYLVALDVGHHRIRDGHRGGFSRARVGPAGGSVCRLATVDGGVGDAGAGATGLDDDPSRTAEQPLIAIAPSVRVTFDKQFIQRIFGVGMAVDGDLLMVGVDVVFEGEEKFVGRVDKGTKPGLAVAEVTDGTFDNTDGEAIDKIIESDYAPRSEGCLGAFQIAK